MVSPTHFALRRPSVDVACVFVCSDVVLTLPRLLTHRLSADPHGLTVRPPRSS